MLRRILPPLIVAFTFLLDTAIVPVFGTHWLIPLFALITVHTMGMLLGRTTGALYGMIIGLFVDISVSMPLGLMTGFYTMLGYAGGLFGRKLYRLLLAPAISAAVCFAVFEIGMALYTTIAGAAFVKELFVRALIRWGLDVVLVQALYMLYQWIIQPNPLEAHRD